MIKGKRMHITPLKRQRRVRVTQRDENGNILMEHSFPVADGVARIDYVIDDEFVPNLLETHTALAWDIVLHS